MSHPNRIPFQGILTYVDVPSDRAPAGSRGRCVILTRAAAEAGLHSLIGMAVDYCPDWSGHDARRKCGIITSALIVASVIEVKGYIFGRDFPEIERHMKKSPADCMGMSYEVADAHVEAMKARVWRLTKITFTGASILLRSKAAYEHTNFELKDECDEQVPLRLAASLS